MNAEPGEQTPSSSESLRDYDARPPAAKMFVSFLFVSAFYLLLFLLLGGLYYALIAFIAPDVMDIWAQEQNEFKKTVEKDPNLIWPSKVAFLFLAGAMIISAGIGFLISHVAQFGKLGHGGVLGLVCFVTILQMGLSNPATPQWIMLACLFLIPFSIILGSLIRSKISSQPTSL